MMTCLLPLFVVSLLASVQAFPTGAGGCAGQGSVGGSHLTRNEIVTGGLMDFSLTVDLGDDPMSSSETTEVAIGKRHNLLLYRPEDDETKQFRGFLFRLSGAADVDTTMMLGPPSNTSQIEQEASPCASMGLGSATHKDSDLKNTAVANLEFPDDTAPDTEFTLEVTAVIANRMINDTAAMSEYYWSSFTLKAVVGATEAPVPAPAPTTSEPTAGAGGGGGDPTSAAPLASILDLLVGGSLLMLGVVGL